jgi:hypothetical protein
MLMDGRVAELIEEANDSRVKRVARMIHDVTKPTITFTQATRVATLASCGAVGKACKIAFSYGTESILPCQANEVDTAHACATSASRLQVHLRPDPD